MKKSRILGAAYACIFSLGLMSVANAVPVLYMDIEDIGSTVLVSGSHVYSGTLDGKSGGFRFGTPPFNPVNYDGTGQLFTSDVGPLLFAGNANPVGSFSTGFPFNSGTGVPYTFGNNLVADITLGPLPTLSFSELNWGGRYTDGAVLSVNQSPDAGTFIVNWLIDNGGGAYKAQFQWSHFITAAEDPTGVLVGFTGNWILEGCLYTNLVATNCGAVVPVPATVWLFGSGLLGLIGMARRKKVYSPRNKS